MNDLERLWKRLVAILREANKDAGDGGVPVPPTPPAPPEPAPSSVVKASFLWDNAGGSTLYILGSRTSNEAFEASVKRVCDLGCNTIWMYTSNQGDFGGKSVSFYKNSLIYGDINKPVLAEMQRRVRYCRMKGLHVVLWLFADDSSTISKQPADVQKAYISTVVKEFDSLVSGYVVALEANEHLSFDRVNAMAAHLNGITDKPIGLHMTPGKYDWGQKIGAVDTIYYQHGFGKSAGEVKSITASVVAKAGKPVIAAEYSKNPSRDLSNAALSGGACGVGNWG